MVCITKEFVSITVDLTRLKIPLVQDIFSNIYLIGKEIELLECIRRSEKDKITLNLLVYHGLALDIPRYAIEQIMLNSFIEFKMLNFIDDKNIILLFSNSRQVYNYGLRRLEEATEREIMLLDFIVRTTKKPIHEQELYDVIDLYDKPSKIMIEPFLVENNVLRPFDYKDERYYVSPRIYKDEDKFRIAYEILEDYKLTNINDFLRDNPGNPQSVVQTHLGTNTNVIDILNQAGLVDPLKLNVEGDIKSYLYSSDILLSRDDKDHFDLVKMTLANFRYGEYYSKISKLDDLDKFLSSLLDRGYAGLATPIGTDYKNLELAGIVRVQKVIGDRHRFWLLKRDVIEDALSIVRGYIPIESSYPARGLLDIENIVKTRSTIHPMLDEKTRYEVIKAMRQIEEALS